MSHFNLIAKTNPEIVSEETQKKVATRILDLNNKMVKHTFDSADYYKEQDLTKKENETETMNQRLANPPMIQRKFPILRQELTPRKKTFDSADYFLEIYNKAPVN